MKIQNAISIIVISFFVLIISLDASDDETKNSTTINLDSFKKDLADPKKSMILMKMIIDMSASEKKALSDEILKKKMDFFNLLPLFMNKHDVFSTGIKKLDTNSKLTKTQQFLVFAVLQGTYYYPDITDRQRNDFIRIIQKGIYDERIKLMSIETIGVLQLKSLIPDLQLAFNGNKVKLEERLQILTCLAILKYKKINDLKNDMREELCKIKDINKMEVFAEEMNDKKMFMNIDIYKLESKDANTRLEAVLRLRKRTGHNFCYNPMGNEEERKKAIFKWEKWKENNTNEKQKGK